MNKKSIKSLNQYQERNYAPKERKLEKGDLIKHCNRGESRETSQASCSNSLQQSREIKEEEMITYPLYSDITITDEIIIYNGPGKDLEHINTLKQEDLIQLTRENPPPSISKWVEKEIDEGMIYIGDE